MEWKRREEMSHVRSKMHRPLRLMTCRTERGSSCHLLIDPSGPQTGPSLQFSQDHPGQLEIQSGERARPRTGLWGQEHRARGGGFPCAERLRTPIFLPFASAVILGKSLPPSWPQFPYLWNGTHQCHHEAQVSQSPESHVLLTAAVQKALKVIFIVLPEPYFPCASFSFANFQIILFLINFTDLGKLR